jgi:autotransporter-associated beta strand protein
MTLQAQAKPRPTTEVLDLATTVLDAVVGGSFGVTKAGPGTLTLSASNNTYRGTTTVADGVLV